MWDLERKVQQGRWEHLNAERSKQGTTGLLQQVPQGLAQRQLAEEEVLLPLSLRRPPCQQVALQGCRIQAPDPHSKILKHGLQLGNYISNWKILI